MVEALMTSSTFVPNSLELKSNAVRCVCVTGPNMGGKSSYSRTAALLVIMAQLGSFVPAKSMQLGVFDGIFTRMGARDQLSASMSTFLLELSEASTILHRATDKSLIIFDEVSQWSIALP
jgi:DNA mismatch repair ATPase MutS